MLRSFETIRDMEEMPMRRSVSSDRELYQSNLRNHVARFEIGLALRDSERCMSSARRAMFGMTMEIVVG